MAGEQSAVMRVLTQMQDLDVRATLSKRSTEIAQNNPIKVSIWIFGLLLGAFANGFAVDEGTAESYLGQLFYAEGVSIDADLAYQKAVQRQQWCFPEGAVHDLDIDDDTCVQANVQLEMASAHVDTVRRHDLMKEARKQVGIWSSFGVADVRKSFWSSWDAGKKWANKGTIVNSTNPRIVTADCYSTNPCIVTERLSTAYPLPSTRPGRVLFRTLVNYIRCNALGLVGALGCFVYTLCDLVCSYDESFASGIAFVLLVVVASMAFLGTCLVALYFTAGGSLVGGAKWLKWCLERRALRALEAYRTGLGGRTGCYIEDLCRLEGTYTMPHAMWHGTGPVAQGTRLDVSRDGRVIVAGPAHHPICITIFISTCDDTAENDGIIILQAVFETDQRYILAREDATGIVWRHEPLCEDPAASASAGLEVRWDRMPCLPSTSGPSDISCESESAPGLKENEHESAPEIPEELSAPGLTENEHESATELREDGEWQLC